MKKDFFKVYQKNKSDEMEHKKSKNTFYFKKDQLINP